MFTRTHQRSLRVAGAVLVAAAMLPWATGSASATNVTPQHQSGGSTAEKVNRDPDVSKTFTSDENKASAWLGINGATECYKHNPGDYTSHGSVQSDKSIWRMGNPPAGKDFALLVLKSGTTNDVWYNPWPGSLYGTKSGKDISHIIVCKKPAPPAHKDCVKSDIEVVSHNTPLTTGTVRIKPSSVSKGVDDCWVSLNSYSTDGPTWATSGTQVFLDHDQVHLTADEPQGVLNVTLSECYGQTDLYLGTTRFDGIDGALPHYPNSSTPTNNIIWWNGGAKCTPPTTEPPTTEPPTTEPPTTEPPTTEPPTTEPPTTEPPTTEPPTTEPPTTEPPTTEPPTTEPPTTEPPTTEPPTVDPRDPAVSILEPLCDGDVPYLLYSVDTSGQSTDQDVEAGANDTESLTITWVNPDGDDVVMSGLPLTGAVLWPGAVVDEDGFGIDWPGWTQQDDGTWVVGDEFDWVRPSVDVIFTVDSTPTQALVNKAVVGLAATYSKTVTVDYPPSSPECLTDPPEDGVVEGSDPAPKPETGVLGEKIVALPQTGGNGIGTQVGISLVLMTVGGLMLAMTVRRRPAAAERRH